MTADSRAPSPWLAIKSKAAALVKPTAAIFACFAALAGAGTPAHAQQGDYIDDGSPAPDLPTSGAPAGGDDFGPPSGGGPNVGNPSGSVDQSPGGSGDEDEEDGAEALSIDEVKQFDPWSQWLSAEFGYFRNSGVNGSAASYFAGGGVRYGITLLDRFIADSNHAQDAIVIEGGVFYYRVVNFLQQGDSYTLVPLIGTVRYDLAFSDNFAVFFYAGFMLNEVVQASNATGQQGLALQTPAVGAGFFYRIGPNWDARVDVGTDTAQAGLVLRF